MHCPNCLKSETRVIETRVLNQGASVRRRRKCEQCLNRYTTYETINIKLPVVLKADGRRENFNREKMIKGLTKACQKRPVSADQIEELVDAILSKVSKAPGNEIISSKVGNLLMDELLNLDPVAYVRFASFYWDFQDIEGFIQTLKSNSHYFNSELINKEQYVPKQ